MSIGVEEFIDMFEILTWDGIETWKITEEFKRKNEYTLVGLEIEVEQGTVCAADAYGEIYSSPKVLMGFLVTSIKDIVHKNKAEFTMYFNDGTITIKGINEHDNMEKK